MADILLDAQSIAATPAAGQVVIHPLTGTLRMVQVDQNGKRLLLGGLQNSNTADVTASGANTYLTGSALALPAYGLQAGAIFRWRLVATKTAAGVAAAVWTVVVGTAGTTADAARLTFTSGSIQTAAVDAGFINIVVNVRSVSASGVISGGLTMTHNGNTAGMASIPVVTLQATSAGFDMTVANLIVGICCNPGASGVWTYQVVQAEMVNG
jgi:hypothetical protein